MFLFLVDGNLALDDPTDRTDAGLFRGFIVRNSDVGAAALTLDMFLFRAVCGNHIIWGFQHVVGFRRRHVGASIQEAWTASLDSVQTALDADPAHEADDVLEPPDDVVAADSAEQKHIQGEGGGTDVAVPENESAEQSSVRRIGRVVEIAVAVH